MGLEELRLRLKKQPDLEGQQFNKVFLFFVPVSFSHYLSPLCPTAYTAGSPGGWDPRDTLEGSPTSL